MFMATATAVAMAALLLPVPETFVIEQPEPAVQEAPPEPAAKRPSRPQQKSPAKRPPPKVAADKKVPPATTVRGRVTGR